MAEEAVKSSLGSVQIKSHVATCTIATAYRTDPRLISHIVRKISLSIILMQFPVSSERRQSSLPQKPIQTYYLWHRKLFLCNVQDDIRQGLKKTKSVPLSLHTLSKDCDCGKMSCIASSEMTCVTAL